MGSWRKRCLISYEKAQIYLTAEAAEHAEFLASFGVVVASDTGDSPADAAEGFVLHSLTYNSGASPAQLGELLEIRLIAVDLSGGYEVDFDDVKLFHSSERVDLYEDKKIDFKDFAELAVWWLDEQLYP